MDSHCTPVKHSWFSWLCSWFQSPLLLLIRVIWGLLFIQAGVGKFGDMGKVIEFFSSLDIPYPVLAAWLVAFTETIGGGLILLGLWSRLASIPLIIVLCTAYATDDKSALMNIFGNFQEFMKTEPFTYLFAVLVIFAFGPGCFSLDWFWGCAKKKKKES
ncbi:MAG: putative oxidoreductase CatD [Chlamydiae bacterium]|nr:putative oxidoreductase CatD [Chlamydiota bacterium]